MALCRGTWMRSSGSLDRGRAAPKTMDSFPRTMRRVLGCGWEAGGTFLLVALTVGFTITAGFAAGPAPADVFPGRLIGAGDRPGAPVVADFNGDAVADIAVANRDSGNLS